MPRPDYIPRRDVDCRAWAANLARQRSVDPARFGVPADLAAELLARVDDFAAALTAATDPPTRTRPAVATKDAARRRLTELARRAARLVKANVDVSAPDLIDLG